MTDRIADKYGLSQSTVNNARIKMTRLGLIRKREGFWMFSTVFAKALERLIETIEVYQIPVDPEEQEKVRLFVEIA